MKKTMTFLFLIFFGGALFSQNPATKYIDFNNISGRINNTGYFFNNQGMQTAGYSVPKNQQKTTIYQFAVWMGALNVNNLPNVITNVYNIQQDANIGQHIAGPWSSTGQYQDNDYLFKYFYSLWEVSKSEIDYHIANYTNPGYVIPQSIAEWPGNGDVSVGVSQQLAPFVDLNGNGLYEPGLGEYPDIPGGKAVYLITTDRNSYPNAGLGLEMHFMFYQFNFNNVLNNTTFLNVKVINKSTMDYHDFKMSLYIDPDLGGWSDDFIGTDTLLNMVYAYNGDAFDDDASGAIGYGANPPAQGVMSLTRPLESSVYYTNGSAFPYSDPDTLPHFWNTMNGLWSDGSYMRAGGAGSVFDSIYPITKFYFPGDPTTEIGWSELNTNPLYTPNISNPPGDRRMVMSIGFDDLPVGTSVCSDFAFVTSYTGGDHLANVTSLKNACTYIQQLYDADDSFPCRKFYLGVEDIQEQDFSIFPNPNNGNFIIETKDLLDESQLQIISLTGEVVYEAIVEENYHSVDLDVDAGVYFVRISTSKGQTTKRIIIE